jgi:hypothetical protein
MSSLDTILQNALAKAKGNKHEAKRMLMEMAVKEEAIAAQLAIPFLESIAGYALDHYIRKNGDRVIAAAKHDPVINRPETPKPGSQAHKDAMSALIGAYKKKE